MKILLVTKQVFEIRQNAVYCDFAISSTIRRFERMGELHICSYHFKGDNAQPLNVQLDVPTSHIHFLNNESSLHYRYIDRSENTAILEREIKNVDLVIGYIPCTVGDLAERIARRFGKKYMTFLVACIWDGMWYHKNWKARIMAPVQFWETKRTVKNSDYVWYVTEEFLQRRYPTNGKTLGCTDTNIPIANEETLKLRLQRINTDHDEFRLLTIGNLSVGFKGQKYIIKALPAILKAIPNTHFYMIGGGDGDYLIRLAERLNVVNHIHILGTKSREKVLNIMDNCDVYVQASLQEGLPRSMAEAMSRAMPCIGSRTGGIPEMLDDDYIVRRKSYKDIAQKVIALSKDTMQEQAKRNFNKAKDYQPYVIDKKVNSFFNMIENDIKTGGKGA